MMTTVKPASRHRRIVRWSVILITCVLTVGSVASWFVAGALVAPCMTSIGTPPSELDAVEFVVDSESGSQISGWHVRSKERNGVIVLLHGIHDSRIAMLERAKFLLKAGYSSVLIDFQAHGESPGTHITIGHLEQHDVRAAVDFARREHSGEPIGIIGVSMGGAATLLASPTDVDAIVIESVYPTITEAIHNRVAARLGPLAWVPAEILLLQLRLRLGIAPSQLEPINQLRKLGCPVFVVSGAEDLHTTEAEARCMFEVASEPKEIWIVPKAGHVDLFAFTGEEYQSKIVGFLKKHLRKS